MIFYRNFDNSDAYSCLHLSTQIRKSIDRLINFSQADLQWHEHPHRWSTLERRRKRDMEVTTATRTKRGRSMINYLFLREARRQHAQIASISRGHTARSCLILSPHTRDICREYIKTIRFYIEKSELNSSWHISIFILNVWHSNSIFWSSDKCRDGFDTRNYAGINYTFGAIKPALKRSLTSPETEISMTIS